MAWLGLSQRSARLGVREPGGGPPWWKEVFLKQISVSCKWALIRIHGAGVNWFHMVWMMSLTCGGAELGSAGEATERSGSASIWHFQHYSLDANIWYFHIINNIWYFHLWLCHVPSFTFPFYFSLSSLEFHIIEFTTCTCGSVLQRFILCFRFFSIVACRRKFFL